MGLLHINYIILFTKKAIPLTIHWNVCFLYENKVYAYIVLEV